MAERALEIIRGWFRAKPTGIRGRHTATQNELLAIAKFISTWIKEDEIAKSISSHCKNEANSSKWKPFSLLKHHPLLCGTFVYYINTRILWLGVLSDSNQHAIFLMTHVYNAAKQSQLLPQIWPDMGFIISIRGESNLFVGALPHQHKDYFKRYQLALDVSVLSTAENRRIKDVRFSKPQFKRTHALQQDGYGRMLKMLAPIHEIFKPMEFIITKPPNFRPAPIVELTDS